MKLESQIKALKIMEDCVAGVWVPAQHEYLKQVKKEINCISIQDDKEFGYVLEKRRRIINYLDQALKYKTYKNMEKWIEESRYLIEHLIDGIDDTYIKSNSLIKTEL